MFTVVHLHLLLNHLPIIVTALALALLAVAVWRGNDTLTRTGLVFLVVAALSALPVYLSGEGAEDAADKLPGVTEALIERHSDIALVAAIVVGALGIAAQFGLWRYRRPIPVPRGFLLLMIIGTFAGSGLMAWTGLLGGQIRHTEVRAGYGPAGGGVSAGEVER